MNFLKNDIFCDIIKLNFEIWADEQRHLYFRPFQTASHHVRPRMNCRGVKSKVNQEPLFYDIQSMDH